MTDVKAPRPFAVSTREVTIQQYLHFNPKAEFRIRPNARPINVTVEFDPYPATMVSFLDAMRYCRWLSDQEGLREDQMCYPTITEISASDAYLTEERRGRFGYRLPTEGEWEFIADAGATTASFVGVSMDNLVHFAWFALNSEDHLQRTGSLRPNPLGLFDLFGNASEWCHPTKPTDHGALRGGNYTYPADALRSRRHDDVPAFTGYSFTGFRVVRTLAPTHQQGE